MDRRQTLIVVGLMVLVAVAIVAAVYYVQSMERSSSSGIGATGRFTAKSGTSRENAVALTSSKREHDAAARTGTMGTRGGGSPGTGVAGVEPLRPLNDSTRDKPLQVRSLSGGDDEELSANERAVREALNSLDPARAIEKLEAVAAEGSGDMAPVHRALGELYGRLDPPDLARAQAAFARARALALTHEDRHAAVLAEVEMLILQGREDLARVELDTALAGEDLNTVSGVKLGVLHGQLQERAGDLAGAEAAYKAAFDRAIRMDPAIAEEGLRLAALRLAQTYHAQTRHTEAEAVAHAMQRRLDGAPVATGLRPAPAGSESARERQDPPGPPAPVQAPPAEETPAP